MSQSKFKGIQESSDGKVSNVAAAFVLGYTAGQKYAARQKNRGKPLLQTPGYVAISSHSS